MWRCNSRTSISVRVPAASPCASRAASHQASCTGVHFPAARAWSSAVAPRPARRACAAVLPGSGPSPGCWRRGRRAVRGGRPRCGPRGPSPQKRAAGRGPGGRPAAPTPSSSSAGRCPARSGSLAGQEPPCLEVVLGQRLQKGFLDGEELADGSRALAGPALVVLPVPCVDLKVSASRTVILRCVREWSQERRGSRTSPFSVYDVVHGA